MRTYENPIKSHNLFMDREVWKQIQELAQQHRTSPSKLIEEMLLSQLETDQLEPETS